MFFITHPQQKQTADADGAQECIPEPGVVYVFGDGYRHFHKCGAGCFDTQDVFYLKIMLPLNKNIKSKVIL